MAMKDITSLRGLRKLKTVQSLKKRPTSRFKSSSYITLYMLKEERKRLLKENNLHSTRMETIRTRVAEIDLEVQQLQQDIAVIESGENENFLKSQQVAQAPDVKKEWKTMPLAY
jgi:hypothetical protein